MCPERPSAAVPARGSGWGLAMARRVLAAQAGTGAGAAAASSALLESLAAAIEAAQRAEPAVRVDEEVWCRYLAARLPPVAELQQRLPRLHLDDLYLCCGCAVGDRAALAAFHRRLVPVIAATLARLRLGQGLREELQQELVQRLLVAEPASPPLLARYSGAGTLASWLRVVVARAGRRGLEREKHVVVSDDQRLASELIAAQPGADLLYAKSRYREAFRDAFREAMQALSPREITLLRQRHVDGLGLEELGAIYRVHHSTVHRWLEKTRALLLDQITARLAGKLRIPPRECSTIIRLVQSDVDLTLRTLLGLHGAAGGPSEGRRGPR